MYESDNDAGRGRISFSSHFNEKENDMKKFTILGATAILFSLFAGPVVANPAAIPTAHLAQVCDPRDPGNPYSERYDYWEWSAFRARGSYDTRAEWSCQPIPSVAYQKGWLQGF
jgi:hypothetical protein